MSYIIIDTSEKYDDREYTIVRANSYDQLSDFQKLRFVAEFPSIEMASRYIELHLKKNNET